MPKGKVTVPETLSGHAAEIYRSAFTGAYDSTCKTREDRDACAAKIAWSAVKKKYKKGKEGAWAEKSFEEYGVEINGVPLPASLFESPLSAALTWIEAFENRYVETGNMANAATHAWSALKERYEQSDLSGQWVLKDGAQIVRASEEAPEVASAEPIVRRSPSHAGVNFQSGSGRVILDGLTFDQEKVLLERGYGDQPAACPAEMDQIMWMDRPSIHRTVKALIRDKWISRAYHEAVKRYAQRHGFTHYDNPNGSGEQILTGHAKVEGTENQFVVTGVLTCQKSLDGTKPEHWPFRALSRGTLRGGTTAIRIPVDEVRFRGPVLR